MINDEWDSNDEWTTFYDEKLVGKDKDQQLENILRKILTNDKYKELNKNFGGTIPFCVKLDRATSYVTTPRANFLKCFNVLDINQSINRSPEPLTNPFIKDEYKDNSKDNYIRAIVKEQSEEQSEEQTKKQTIESSDITNGMTCIFTVKAGRLKKPEELFQVKNLSLHEGKLDKTSLDKLKEDGVINQKGKEFLSERINQNSPTITETDSIQSGQPPVEVKINEFKKRLKYNYDPERIRQFLISLKTSQLTLLCGDPGTGKTTFVTEMARALGAKLTIVEVQNNWTDTSDLLGYYDPVNKRYNSTAFLDAIIDADSEEANKKEEDARLHIICLDEMNLSRIEYYFATFLSLLQQEPNKREIRLLPRDVERELTSSNDSKSDSKDPLASYLKFTLPSNVRFVGTLNMDASTQMLSPKVIDRSLFIEFTTSDAAERNKNYPPDDLENGYYPASIFKEEEPEEESKILDEMDKAPTEYINARLKKYAEEMFPFYKKLSKQSPYTEDEFLDTILLTKILPKVTRKLDDGISDYYDQSHDRYEAGVIRGEKNHPFDESTWSFWE